MKDNFSEKSGDYARFRPTYPPEVFSFLRSKLQNCQVAWDCGTGNGQVAVELANFFDKVKATDISSAQLKNAKQRKNIVYSVQPAESTNFQQNSFDLVTCGQAVHWFDFQRFYAEVKRCLKPDALIAILGYGLFTSNEATNEVIHHFYNNIIGPYWDKERKYLEDNYQSIPFPFQEWDTPALKNRYEWQFRDLLGYLRTWSAVKHYQKANGRDPVDLIEKDLHQAFGNKDEVSFPILFRLGKNIGSV